jgi:hypothetical protein
MLGNSGTDGFSYTSLRSFQGNIPFLSKSIPIKKWEFVIWLRRNNHTMQSHDIALRIVLCMWGCNIHNTKLTWSYFIYV